MFTSSSFSCTVSDQGLAVDVTHCCCLKTLVDSVFTAVTYTVLLPPVDIVNSGVIQCHDFQTTQSCSFSSPCELWKVFNIDADCLFDKSDRAKKWPMAQCFFREREQRVSGRDMFSSVEHVHTMAGVHHVSARETFFLPSCLTWLSILFKSESPDTFLTASLAPADVFPARWGGMESSYLLCTNCKRLN